MADHMQASDNTVLVILKALEAFEFGLGIHLHLKSIWLWVAS